MDELVKLLAAKTGLPEDKAKMAIETVIGFMKQRLPGSVGDQLTSCLTAPSGEGLVDKVKGMAESVGGVFTKKAG